MKPGWTTADCNNPAARVLAVASNLVLMNRDEIGHEPFRREPPPTIAVYRDGGMQAISEHYFRGAKGDNGIAPASPGPPGQIENPKSKIQNALAGRAL